MSRPSLRLAGFGLLALSCVVGTSLPRMASAQTKTDSETPGSESAPSRTDLTSFVRRLDDHFNAADPDGFLQHFDRSCQPIFYATLAGKTRQLARPGTQARSTVLTHITKGDVAVGLVRTQYVRQGKSMSRLQYVAIEQRGSRMIGRFSVIASPAAEQGVGHGPTFSCKACNYRIRYGNDWLAVPRLGSRARCMESVWLVSLVNDVYIETSVQVDDANVTARQALTNCVESDRGRKIAKEDLAFNPWRPSQLANKATNTVSSIRGLTRCPAGTVAEMNMVSTGQLRYLVVVRGMEQSLQTHRTAIDQVVDSFEILDLELTPQGIADKVRLVNIAHTGGGTFDKHNTYTSKKFLVAIDGPAGWTNQVRPGPWLFKLTYRPQKQSPDAEQFFTVVAYAKGSMRWTRKRVVHDFSSLKLAGKQWEAKSHGFERLTISRRTGILQFALHSDLLLVMRASTADPATRKLLREAMASARTIK